VDTNAKKMELFKKGLNSQLHEHLTLLHNGNFNEPVSAATEQEDASHAHMDKEERNRKRHMSGPPGGASSKYRLIYTPSAG
jgi:hypothetical protein